MSRSPDFDWYKDRDDLVIEEQAAIAVYRNPRGSIVIRQKGDLDPETYSYEDSWIVVEPHYAAQLARAILAMAPEQPAPLALPAPADNTAAGRQRRYRERKRNGDTVAGHDGDGVTRDGRNGGGTVTDPDGRDVTKRHGDGGGDGAAPVTHYWPVAV